MEEKLSVEIGAKLDGLSKGMTQAVAITTAGANKIDRSTITLQKNLNTLNKTPFTFGANFQRSATQATASVKQLDAAVSKSSNNMRAWLYIIQDAPFGLMGIQNNLTQLIPGVGAASLAFSALISALTFSQVGMTYWNRGAKDTTATAKTLTDEVDEYIKTLGGLQSAQLKAAESSSKDVASLDRLYKATQNTNLSLTERKKAVDLLQSEYPAYFKNISDETILNGGAKSSYDRLTASIIAKAKAQAYADQIATSSKELMNSEKLLTSLIEERGKLANKIESDLSKRIEAQNKQYTEQQKSFRLTGEEADKYIQKQLQGNERIQELDAKILDIRSKNIPVAGEIMVLEKEISNLIGEQGVEVLGLDSKLGKVEDTYKRINTEALNITKILKDENAEREKGLKLISQYLSAASGASGANASNLSNRVVSIPLQFQLVGTEALSEEALDKLIKQQDWEDKVDDMGKRIGSIFRNSLSNGIGDIFEALGSTIASGGNFAGQMASVLLTTIGDMAIQLGKLAIGTGIAIEGIKTALKSLNPAIAIAGGAALVALGSFVKSAAASIGAGGSPGGGYQIPAFANGGIVSGPTLGLMGEYPGAKSNPEVIAPLNKLKSMIGGGSNTFIPDVRISGQDLVVVFDRASKSRNRIT